MKIEEKKIKIKDLYEKFKDNDEEGVYGYGGILSIRPKYQREFVYDDTKKKAVINTVIKGFPLNVMYFAKTTDGKLEVLDGQQRILSICHFLQGDFSISFERNDSMYFSTFETSMSGVANKILNYELIVYICEGDDKEKLDWFETINIAGEKLTEQELRNAVYTGTWLTDAKKKFSKTNCIAYKIGEKYMNGVPIRQDYLETVLKWISNGDIDEYMSAHQKCNDALELWDYFNSVIDWAKRIFPNYRKEMKGLPWGEYYNKYHNNSYNANELEKEVKELMQDDDVTKKKGIYEYLLSNKEKESSLSIRTFTDSQKRTAYEKQNGVCPNCGKHFEYNEMQGDHKTPWSKGGKTIPENLIMLCRNCNLEKSDK